MDEKRFIVGWDENFDNGNTVKEMAVSDFKQDDGWDIDEINAIKAINVGEYITTYQGSICIMRIK